MSRRARSDGGPRDATPVPVPEPTPVPVVDTHCHLDLMDGEIERALADAGAAGVATMLSVGIDVATSRWQAQLAAEHRQVWAAVAVHPNEAARGGAGEADLAEIGRLAALPQVRAVGETGLDHFRTEGEDGRARQVDSFRAHIDIAKRAGKALVIHDREAHESVLQVLREEGPPPVTVFHAFSGDENFARRCAEQGYLMSFAGNVSFANAPALRAAAAAVPADLLLVETDAPFLTPVPFRGRPNGPHLIPLTLRALATARGEELEQTCAAVARNAARAFGW